MHTNEIKKLFCFKYMGTKLFLKNQYFKLFLFGIYFLNYLLHKNIFLLNPFSSHTLNFNFFKVVPSLSHVM